MVAVHVGRALLLVRASYRVAWGLPGGGIKRGEAPEAAARRELGEEIGLGAEGMVARGVACGIWDGRKDRVHFFELRLDGLPELRVDNREIVAARLVLPEELGGMRVTGPVMAYLEMTGFGGGADGVAGRQDVDGRPAPTKTVGRYD